MLDEFERPGKLEGAGFYEYADGKRTRLWPGLREAFPPVADPTTVNLKDLQERMLFIEALETVKCVDEGVIESVADANIGSIMGIGFPGWTGGVLQYINGYEGGVAGFVARSRELAAAVRRALRAAGLARREGRARRDLHGRAGAGHGLTPLGASVVLVDPWLTNSTLASAWRSPRAAVAAPRRVVSRRGWVGPVA